MLCPSSRAPVPAPARASRAPSRRHRRLQALGLAVLSRCPLRSLVTRAASRRGLAAGLVAGGAAVGRGAKAEVPARQLFRVADGNPKKLQRLCLRQGCCCHKYYFAASFDLHKLAA